MEELKPEELEELVQELEGESEEEEALSPEVEKLLRGLGRWSPEHTRRDAAEQLGRVGTSSPRIVQALIAACDSPSSPVSTAAANSLRAWVHQEILQQYPELMQPAPGVREALSRKETKVGLAEASTIAFGIVWVGVIAYPLVSRISAAPRGTQVLWFFGFLGLLALPGIAVLAFGLWRWRAATINREALLRSMKETVGIVEDLRKSKGTVGELQTLACYVTVRFEAEDAKTGTRVIALRAQVAHHLWKGLRSGESVGIRYAAEDPRIALIQGEW